MSVVAHVARDVRGGAVLRRQHDHAGDLGALGRRGPVGREPTVFDPFVVPITIVVLIGLFVVQSKGTATVGALFGPIMDSGSPSGGARRRRRSRTTRTCCSR
jgi:hypothetical protein